MIGTQAKLTRTSRNMTNLTIRISTNFFFCKISYASKFMVYGKFDSFFSIFLTSQNNKNLWITPTQNNAHFLNTQPAITNQQ